MATRTIKSTTRTNTHDHTPAPYRTDPGKLVLQDISLAFRECRFWIDIVWPVRTDNPNGELNFRQSGNRNSMFMHLLLIIVSVAALGLIPMFFFVPGVVWGSCCLVCVGVVYAISKPLNGGFGKQPEGYTVIESSGRYAEDFADEKWVFVNGVMAGNHWTQSAVNELERRFRRRIYGVHNKTYGLILDLVQCIIQRALGWTSADIRAVYAELRKDLLERNADKQFRYKKVVVVAHSQGALILSLVLDMLYADLAPEAIRKLEIYTFGNAANHFNNPPIHDSAALVSQNPQPQGLVKHIEHYVNGHDFVSLFGVLEYTPKSPGHTHTKFGEKILSHFHSREDGVPDPSEGDNQFTGQLFVRYNQPGHQFVQHYLDSMFSGWNNDDGMDGVSVFEMSKEEQVSRGVAGKTALKNGKENGPENKRQESRLWSYRGGRTQD